jgi:hypothetical protein
VRGKRHIYPVQYLDERTDMPLEKMDDPIEVSLEQLTTAIDLFIAGTSYISAITLAVAAEQILQRALKKRGQTDVLRWEFEFFDENRSHIAPQRRRETVSRLSQPQTG